MGISPEARGLERIGEAIFRVADAIDRAARAMEAMEEAIATAGPDGAIKRSGENMRKGLSEIASAIHNHNQ